MTSPKFSQLSRKSKKKKKKKRKRLLRRLQPHVVFLFLDSDLTSKLIKQIGHRKVNGELTFPALSPSSEEIRSDEWLTLETSALNFLKVANLPSLSTQFFNPNFLEAAPQSL